MQTGYTAQPSHPPTAVSCAPGVIVPVVHRGLSPRARGGVVD